MSASIPDVHLCRRPVLPALATLRLVVAFLFVAVALLIYQISTRPCTCRAALLSAAPGAALHLLRASHLAQRDHIYHTLSSWAHETVFRGPQPATRLPPSGVGAPGVLLFWRRGPRLVRRENLWSANTTMTEQMCRNHYAPLRGYRLGPTLMMSMMMIARLPQGWGVMMITISSAKTRIRPTALFRIAWDRTPPRETSRHAENVKVGQVLATAGRGVPTAAPSRKPAASHCA